jgi:hypothetical protein
MALNNLQREALAMRQAILDDLEREIREAEMRLNEERRAAREAERAARNAERAARNAIREARALEREARPVGTRKRHPGANYNVAGRPAHLAPGASYRRVEGRRSQRRSPIMTRSKRRSH